MFLKGRYLTNLVNLINAFDRFTKKHFKILFPNAECDMPVGGEAILTFKSSDAAQKALESSMDLKLFGARVLIKFNRSK